MPGVWENRRRIIETLVPGRSFIDLGGMWSVHGDAAFWAEEAGATRSLVFDGMDPTEEFEQKRSERSSSVEYVRGDLHVPEAIDAVGTFDVAFCTGVLYHTPNPPLLLEHVRRITREHLVLGTHTIPEIPGFREACIWYPGMSESTREFLAGFEGDWSPGIAGAAKPFDETPYQGYANNWWGMPPSVLRSMLRIARFELIEEFRYDLYSIDFVARPLEQEPVIPPIDPRAN